MIQNFFNEVFSQFRALGLESTVSAGIILAATLFILHFLFFFILKRIQAKRVSTFLKHINDKYRVPSLLFVLLLALNFMTSSIAPDSFFGAYVDDAVWLAIIFSVAWIAIRSVKLGRFLILRQFNLKERDNLKARRIYTQFRIIERVLTFFIILIAVASALMSFESIRDIGVSLFASAGVAGIILGFAAQRMIGTVIAGIQIAITQPIRLDDAVVVEGEWGWIEEINLTYVVIRIWDKRRLVLPTTYFIETPFQNWTRKSADILGTVFLYTDYSVSFDALRGEVTRLLENTDLWDGKVNVLQVTDSTEKTVQIRVLVSAADSPTAWDLRVYLREHLISFLQREYPDSLPKARILLEKEDI